MLRYAISDRRQFAGDDRRRRQRVVRQAAILAGEGVDFFQLREKDLEPSMLYDLVCSARDAVRATGAPMQVVLNGPREIAERAGVAWHAQASQLQVGVVAQCLSCSVHSAEEAAQHRARAAMLLFAPVFGKTVRGRAVQPGAGIDGLRSAVEQAGGTPVLALGGVTLQNAPLCLEAGAAGIAGIRLFLR